MSFRQQIGEKWREFYAVSLGLRNNLTSTFKNDILALKQNMSLLNRLKLKQRADLQNQHRGLNGELKVRRRNINLVSLTNRFESVVDIFVRLDVGF